MKKIFFVTAVACLAAPFAHAAPESWFEKRDLMMQGVSLVDAAAYFSLLTQVPVEVDAQLAQNFYIPKLKVKQKSVDEVLSTYVESNDLLLKGTSKGGFRITKRNPTDLQKLSVRDTLTKLEVHFSEASSEEVLDYLATQRADLNILSYDGFKLRHSFNGNANAEEVINDLAEAEGLSVLERDGIIFFKKPQ